MDYDKLIERWRNLANRWENGEQLLLNGVMRIEDELRTAATALSTLQAENEKLRTEKAKVIGNDELMDELQAVLAENEKLRAELEQVKAERDALIDDFVDYVTGGVPNPAIFCKNRCDKCTDMRGWYTGKDCKGFYPSGASGQKED